MPFTFEKFPGAGRGYSPRASVRKNGQIGFNIGAIMHFGLAQYDKAVLHYDRENKVIGIQPITGDDATACSLIHRQGSSYIAAKSFFDWFRIPIGSETERYPLWRDDGSGMLILELAKPVATKTEERQLDGTPQMW